MKKSRHDDDLDDKFFDNLFVTRNGAPAKPGTAFTVSAAVADTPRASTATAVSTTAVSGIRETFNIQLPSAGLVFLVGSPSSGIKQLVSSLKTATRLRGGQFATDLTYNSVIGSAPGYVGSDTPSPLLQSLHENPAKTVVVDGIEDGALTKLNDFLSMVKNGALRDQTGKLKDVDVSKTLFIFTLHESLHSDTELSLSSLREKLSKLRKPNGEAIVPAALVDEAQLFHLHELLDRPEVIQSVVAPAFNSPTPTRLREAAQDFYLTNAEVFEIAAKAIIVQRQEGRRTLLADSIVYRENRTLCKSDFFAFNSSLDGYHGQEEAIANFRRALALKVQSPSKRPVSLFCVGPPGIGKTEIAKRLGAAIGGYVRVDCNVIKNSSDFFGHAQAAGQLTKGLVRGEPAIILFDEAEKLTKEAALSLLQLLDEGLVNDQHLKETWNVHESILVFTSNAIRDPNVDVAEAREILAQTFPQEFVDRLDFIVPFRYFSAEHKAEIALKFAEKAGLTLTDAELAKVSRPDSIRQIQLEVQQVLADRAVQNLVAEQALGSGRKR